MTILIQRAVVKKADSTWGGHHERDKKLDCLYYYTPIQDDDTTTFGILCSFHTSQKGYCRKLG